MVYRHRRPENSIRKRKKWLSASEQLKMIDLLKHRANPLVLSPAQALNILSAFRNTPGCWELSSGDESCWVKFETGQTFFSRRLNFSFASRSSMCGSKNVECIYTATLNMLSLRTRSAQRIQRFSVMIQHEPLWNLRIAQHVVGVIVEVIWTPRLTTPQKHSKCWELVRWTNPVHLHAALNQCVHKKKVLHSLQYTVS